MTDIAELIITCNEQIDRIYREVCAAQKREHERLMEKLERETESRRILYQGLSRRTRLRLYDRLYGDAA